MPATPKAKFDGLSFVQNTLLLGLWVWLYTPAFGLLRVVATREDFRTNQVLLLGIAILLVTRIRQDIRQDIRQNGVAFRLDQPMHAHGLALAVLLGASALYLLSERFFDINMLAACLFGLGSYGLLGLWLSPQRWREGLPVALLLIGVLPFGDHIQTFVGYPMRVFTAELVRHGLSVTGIASLGSSTILIFENSVAQVDVPCSGVKSLWTGGLFLLAATWVDRKPINLRWVLVACAFVAVLFVANLTRVALLIVMGPVLGWTLLAELVHVPLGVVMFMIACGVAVWLLRQIPVSNKTAPNVRAHPFFNFAFAIFNFFPRLSPRPYAVQSILIATLLAMNLIYTARPRLEAQFSTATLPAAFLQLPAGLNASPVQLRPGELEWLAQDGAEAVERLRFNWRGLTGSMLIVQSTSWRAHHKPERCFENYGLQTHDTHTHLIDGTVPVRALRLDAGKAAGVLSAMYWFQTATPVRQSTDDYSVRLWSAAALHPPRWMLVTVLFDQPYLDQQNPVVQRDVAGLVQAMQVTVYEHLEAL